MNSLSEPVLAIMGLGTPEILIILAVLLLFFGGRKLPELAKGMGKSIKEFKKASNEADEEIEAANNTAPKPVVKSADATKSEPVKTHGTD